MKCQCNACAPVKCQCSVCQSEGPGLVRGLVLAWASALVDGPTLAAFSYLGWIAEGLGVDEGSFRKAIAAAEAQMLEQESDGSRLRSLQQHDEGIVVRRVGRRHEWWLT